MIDSYKHKGLRKQLVEVVREKGIEDEDILDAIGKIPRHLFLDSSFLEFAYQDKPFPIGSGQTISQPYTVAFQTELLEIKKGDKVLEVGTGSGYQAAVLAELTENVQTIEIRKKLALNAAKTLESLGYSQVKVKVADGYFGWPEAAPFEAIIVTAAAEEIPPPLVKQLAPGGRMVIPVGSAGGVQTLVLVEKDTSGDVTTRGLLPVRFVPLVRGKGEK